MLDKKISKLAAMVEESKATEDLGTFKYDIEAVSKDKIKSFLADVDGIIVVGDTDYSMDDKIPEFGVQWILYVDNMHVGTYDPEKAILSTDEDPKVFKENYDIRDVGPGKITEEAKKLEDDSWYVTDLNYVVVEGPLGTEDEAIAIADKDYKDDGYFIYTGKDLAPLQEEAVVEESIKSDIEEIKEVIADTKAELGMDDEIEISDYPVEDEEFEIIEDDEIELEIEDEEDEVTEEELDIEIEDIKETFGEFIETSPEEEFRKMYALILGEKASAEDKDDVNIMAETLWNWLDNAKDSEVEMYLKKVSPVEESEEIEITEEDIAPELKNNIAKVIERLKEDFEDAEEAVNELQSFLDRTDELDEDYTNRFKAVDGNIKEAMLKVIDSLNWDKTSW